MEPTVFKKFCEIAYRRAGISIGPGKEALISTRVLKRMRPLGLADERAYLNYLESDTSGDELVQFLDAISTNYTRFFREPDHFDVLSEAVRRWVAAGQQKLRFWCAASSTGEEPYSIILTMFERFPGVDFDLLATDISTRALARASAGVFDGDLRETVPSSLLDKYFVKGQSENGQPNYTVVPAVRRRVLFRRLNLSDAPYPMRGPLDVIFCRNVMIYFDVAGRQKVATEVERLLKPGGLFIIGHSETLEGARYSLHRGGSSVFTKPGASEKRSTRPIARVDAP